MKKIDYDLKNWSKLADIARRIYLLFYNERVSMYWDSNTYRPVVMFCGYTSMDLSNMDILITAMEVEDVDNDIKLAWYRLHFALLKFERKTFRGDVIKLDWC